MRGRDMQKKITEAVSFKNDKKRNMWWHVKVTRPYTLRFSPQSFLVALNSVRRKLLTVERLLLIFA
jgi:hypothetical protein